MAAVGIGFRVSRTGFGVDRSCLGSWSGAASSASTTNYTIFDSSTTFGHFTATVELVEQFDRQRCSTRSFSIANEIDCCSSIESSFDNLLPIPGRFRRVVPYSVHPDG